jgi:hypothetical protein
MVISLYVQFGAQDACPKGLDESLDAGAAAVEVHAVNAIAITTTRIKIEYKFFLPNIISSYDILENFEIKSI